MSSDDTVLFSKIYAGFISARGSAEALRRLCGSSADRLFSIGIGFRAPCIRAGGNTRVWICFCEGSAEALRRLSGGSADALFPMRSVFSEMCSPWTIAPVNYLHVHSTWCVHAHWCQIQGITYEG